MFSARPIESHLSISATFTQSSPDRSHVHPAVSRSVQPPQVLLRDPQKVVPTSGKFSFFSCHGAISLLDLEKMCSIIKCFSTTKQRQRKVMILIDSTSTKPPLLHQSGHKFLPFFIQMWFSDDVLVLHLSVQKLPCPSVLPK